MVSTSNIKVIDSPAAKVILSRLRDKNTSKQEFRRLLFKAGFISAVEISREIPLKEYTISTPLNVETKAFRFEEISVIGVLRAALPMVWGMLEVFEEADVGFLSAKRKEAESAPPDYRMDVDISYESIPSKNAVIVIVDPMLATGSTLAKVIKRVRQKVNPSRFIVSSLISTNIGIQRILQTDPSSIIYTFAVDPQLNSKAFIVPGLGDAGDRAFN
ncbi:MAG: uracil phosphoribosyltransferase [Infirmifilum sp.]